MVCLLWTSLLALGCVKLKQVITVMPDGAGKIELHYGLSSEQIKMAKESDVDPFKEVMPELMQHKCKGLIAFTEPKTKTIGDYTYLSYTAYFDDINKLRIAGLGEGMPSRFKFKRDGQSATLTVAGGTVLSMLDSYKPVPEHERDQSRKAMAGLSLSEHFVLPGAAEPIKGLTTDGRTAKLDLAVDDLIDAAGPVKDLMGKNTLAFTIPKIEIDDTELNAFKAQRDAAVKAWQLKQKDKK